MQVYNSELQRTSDFVHILISKIFPTIPKTKNKKNNFLIPNHWQPLDLLKLLPPLFPFSGLKNKSKSN